MNAVAAVFGAANPHAARAAVATMLDRMPQRAGGHRLVLAEESGVIGASGTSPVFGSKENIAVLAGDLRLDNRSDLRAELSLPNDAADAIIALEAFAKWGDVFANRLVGDFAFVILDRRSRRLLAVRDPLGIRPLFYRLGVDHVRCASELRALVEAGDAPDEGHLAEMLAGSLTDVEGTPFLSVRRVPAGHSLIAGADGTRLARYWEPSREQHRGSPEDLARQVREVFDESVRARTSGFPKAGVHVSGGLWSSSVLGSICANQYATPVAGSLIFPWPEADERQWIAAAARHWSIAPIQVMASSNPASHDLGGVASHVDIPDSPAGGPLMAPLQTAIREGGANVVLTGFGGPQWWSAGDERPAFLPRVTGPLIRAARHFHTAPLPPWIHAAFARRVDLRDRLRKRPDTSGAPSEAWRRVRWRLESGEEAFAREKLDHAAVAAGVELRHPFYDKRLMELAFGMPEKSPRGASGRHAAVRAAMHDRLPPLIAARDSKADLTPVLLSALQMADVHDHLHGRRLTEVGWLTPGAMSALVEPVLSGSDAVNAGLVWRLIGVEAWLKEIFG